MEVDVIEQQQSLLQTHRNRLGVLLEQHARFGSSYVPAYIVQDIVEAQISIQRIKAYLQTNGVEVDDEPNDAQFLKLDARPSLPSARTALDILADLVRNDVVRASVAVYQTIFADACEQIKTLGRYKILHDLLQQTEDRHSLLFRASHAKRIGQETWLDIEYSEPELYTKISQVLKVADDPLVRTETVVWSPKLRRAQGTLRNALEALDISLLRDALRRIKEVIDRQLSKVDGCLVNTANALHLATLVNALRSIDNQLLNEVADKEAIDKLSEMRLGIESLAKLDKLLASAINMHTTFQAFDDELRRIDATVDRDINDLLESWQDLNPIMEMLCAQTKDSWAILLQELAAEVERSMSTGDARRTRRAFNRYRIQATVSFNQIDQMLLDLCAELQQVGLPLNRILSMLQ